MPQFISFTQTQDMFGQYGGSPYPPDRVVVDQPNIRSDARRLEAAIAKQRTGLAAARDKLAKMRDRVNALYGTPAMNDPAILAMSNHHIPALEIRVAAIETDLGLKERTLERTKILLAQMSEDEKNLQQAQENPAVAAEMGKVLTAAGVKIGDIMEETQVLRERFDQIRSAVGDILIDYYIYARIAEIADSNQLLWQSNDFWGFLDRLYRSSMVIRIRSQIDTHKDVISFRKFLEDLKTSDTKFRIRREEIDSDIMQLDESTKPIKAYTNKYVAHIDKNRSEFNTRREQIRLSIEVLDKLLCKYWKIMFDEDLQTVQSELEFKNWEEIFSFPWITPK
ncbi:MAG: hypothetical protein HYY96_10665 [Candidatus Tectomicrobia bacterium]|nr:hypothetical protein [Candidatus Tectomicrobia bacterium]